MASKHETPSTSSGASEETDDDILPGFKDINEFSQRAFMVMMAAVKASNDLPSPGGDFDYYSSFETFRNLMDIEGSRILHMIQKIMKYHGVRGNIAGNMQFTELEDKFDVVVDANDQLLERVGNFLDEASGLRKQESSLVVASMKSNKQISGSWNRKTKLRTKSSNFRLLAAKNIQRPQIKFKDKIDNSSRPFVPKITQKPNALKSLQESLVVSEADVHEGEYGECYMLPHPYQYELDQFTPLSHQLEKGEIREPLQLEDCPVTFIDCEKDLVELVKHLKKEPEIAVDLEHHSYRTYLGITCLMQLSTRTSDYLVDTLELRSELHVLNEVFTDPNIVKVFHGADLDVEWLQRDLGLYVVNMFDTGQAARVLNLQRFSLAYLLASYCQVEADKQYQLADWRIRPLPQELIKYAQEDTHYLLYIYDKMRNELIDRGNDQINLLTSVLERSKQLCLKSYIKPLFKPDNCIEVYKRSKKVFNSQQMAALHDLYAWRDAFARKEDESLGYILPNHMLLQIGEVLPREAGGILACCNPVPPLVRQNIIEIHTIVKEARERPLLKPELSKPQLQPTKLQHPKYNADSILNCPHDLSAQHKTRDTESPAPDGSVQIAKVSSLFQDKSDIHISSIEMKEFPLLSALRHKYEVRSPGTTEGQMRAAQVEATFINPLHKVRSCGTTEGQMRAAQVKATFINPLHKFLPIPILEKLTTVKGKGSRTAPTMKEEKWKLLPDTMKPAPKHTPIIVPQATVSNEDIVIVEDEPVVSLRKQFPIEKKKRKSDGSSDTQSKKKKAFDNEETTTENEPVEAKVKKGSLKVKKEVAEVKDKAERINKSVFAVPEEDFKPYDYNKTDYGMFDSTSGAQNKKKMKKDFNPDEGALEGRRRGSSKGKPGAGSKSLTYTKQKSGVTAKIQWPKR